MVTCWAAQNFGYVALIPPEKEINSNILRNFIFVSAKATAICLLVVMVTF